MVDPAQSLRPAHVISPAGRALGVAHMLQPGVDRTKKGELQIRIQMAIQVNMLCAFHADATVAHVPVVRCSPLAANRRKIAARNALSMPALHVSATAETQKPCSFRCR